MLASVLVLLLGVAGHVTSDTCSLPPALVEEIRSYQPIADQIISAVVNGTYSGHAYQQMADFVTKYGARLQGSTELESAIDGIIQLVEANGLNASTDPVQIPQWIRGNESGKVLTPREFNLDLLSLGNSPATPPEGITGQVILVKDFDELEAVKDQVSGKIVLFNRPFTTYGETTIYRGRGPAEASRLGAIAALVRSVTPYSLASPHTGATTFPDDVKPIPAVAVTLENAETIARMIKKGHNVTVHLKLGAYFGPDVTTRNVKADLPGSSIPEELVILSGHIDSWDVGQGAIDDAGGVFLSWHSAALIRKLNLTRPKRTIRSIFWTAEETGLLGAYDYLARNRFELENWVAAFESDEGVFQPQGFNFDGTDEAICILQEIVNLLTVINATQIVQTTNVGSDISIFADVGVPIGDPRMAPNNYFWYHHSPADTFLALKSEDIDTNIALMATTAYVLADLSIRLPRKGESTQHLKYKPPSSASLVSSGLTVPLFTVMLLLMYNRLQKNH